MWIWLRRAGAFVWWVVRAAGAVTVAVLFSAWVFVQTDDISRHAAKMLVYYYMAGDPKGALRESEGLNAAVEKAGYPLDNWFAQWARGTLATLHWESERYEEAASVFTRVMPDIERRFGPDSLVLGNSLQGLGWTYALEGRFADAEPNFQRALAIREKALGPEHSDVADSLDALAYTYKYQVKTDLAEPTYRRLIEIREKTLGPDNPLVAASLNNVAELYAMTGRYAEAEPLFKRSLAVLEATRGPNHVEVGQSVSNLAEFYSLQSRFEEQEALSKRALSIFEQRLGRRHEYSATVIMNMGLARFRARRYAAAEPLMLEGISILEEMLGKDHVDVNQRRVHLVMLYQMQGRYAEAEPVLLRVLRGFEKVPGPDSPHTAAALLFLATIKINQRQLAEARPLAARALAIFEAMGETDNQYVPDALTVLATISYMEKDWTQTFDLMDRRASIVERRLKFGGVANPGEAMTGKLTGLDRAKEEVFESILNPAFRLAEAEPARAPELMGKAFIAAQRMASSQAADSLAQMTARQAIGDAALAGLVRERQDLIGEWQAQDSLLLAAASQAASRRSKRTKQNVRERLAALEKRIAEIDVTLKAQFPKYATLATPGPLALADVQAVLHPDEVLIAFAVLAPMEPTPGLKLVPEETFVWAVSKTDTRWIRVDLGKPALIERVAALRCGLDEAAWDGKGQARCAKLLGTAGLAPAGGSKLPFDLAKSHELYKNLFAPIEDFIGGKRLLLVPSGALASLPFQVLVTAPPADGTSYGSADWLIKNHSLFVLPSVPSLVALRAHGAGRSAPETFIGFGDPSLDGEAGCSKVFVPDKCPDESIANADIRLARLAGATRGGSFYRGRLADVAAVRKLCPLPDTAYELRCVARSVGVKPSEILLGPNATETALKKASLDRYRIVHFATHGLLASDTALLSKDRPEPALVLTPPAQPSDVDDGLLTASEIAGLKLNADWVIMSACNTAGSADPDAEALSGLARSFFYAGARSLLVSHWPVNSYAATVLTTRTFNEMGKDPALDRAEALRRAMLALMADEQQAWAAHPAVWAPFVVVGEGGPRAPQ